MKRVIYLCVVMAGVTFAGCVNCSDNGKKEEAAVAGGMAEIVAQPLQEAVPDTVPAEAPRDDAEMEKSVHLRFKGVPIDGTLEKFVSRMERWGGFECKESRGGMAVLTGDFADFKDCTIYVETLDDKDLVARIAVTFPEREQWRHLHGDYDHLKKLLTEKYGAPVSSVEKFQDMYMDDDRQRMWCVQSGRCEYRTRFVVSKGEVALSIEHQYGSFVLLTYKDKINGDAIKRHALEDL